MKKFPNWSDVAAFLDRIRKRVSSQRGQAYEASTPASVNHKHIGRMWAALISMKTGVDVPDLSPDLVSMLLVIYKMARMAKSDRADHYVDAHNYLDMALEMRYGELQEEGVETLKKFFSEYEEELPDEEGSPA